jgi:hypothetical protein
MSRSRLRVYFGPEHDTPAALAPAAAKTVTVPVGEVLSLLADALESKRTWLRDFADDEMTISSDLYEVLLAYEHFRRPSA